MAEDGLALIELTEEERVRANRYKRFVELLGEDFKDLDSLVDNFEIHPGDVKKMLDQGCSKELIAEIML